MVFFYSIGVRGYAFIVRIAALFIPKAKEWVNGRKNSWNTFPSVEGKEVYWFHCASLGEFDQGLPVMNLLREEKPNAFFLVTFFSPSGYHHFQKRKHSVDFVCYLPIDTKKNAKRFVAHFQPKMAFFIKYEFWANYIFELKKTTCKLYSVSTLLRPSQVFFKWYGGFFRSILKQFDCFFAQNQATVNLLHSVGVTAVRLTGDTRFDRVIENKKTLIENEKIRHFINGSNSVFIAGSTWTKDEDLLKNLLLSKRFEKYIIAPHNVDESHVQQLIETIKNSVERYSSLKLSDESSSTILVIDSIGQLSSAYSYASVAYIGGGFSGNLHNILEPAVFGLPVLFGPKFSRFPEAQSFIDEKIGYSIENQQELDNAIDLILKNRTEISQKSSQFVDENKGSARKIVDFIFQI